LGHQRLAILDLSAAGHQPMRSAFDRYVMVFNGEIYNHTDLRARVTEQAREPIAWKGHSDTETLLAGFEVWGIEETLKQAVGMFALAVWDRRDRVLSLARDRMGEKPLYYGWIGNGFVFASELKAFQEFPGFANPLSRDALTLYFRYIYIPAPYSIYQNIFKLEPGCLLTLPLSAAGRIPEQGPHAPYRQGNWRISRYWSLREQVKTGQAALITDEDKAINAVEAALKESVRIQSIADVPLGAFLSGGLDSSLIVALMQSLDGQPVKTFTIGFSESGFNEAEYARAVADHLCTEHTELYLSGAQARDVIPLLPGLYDEPFADSSQIPTFLVAQMTRNYVTVALSGDGGDELFGGYNRYFWVSTIWNKISWLPFSLRQRLCRMLIRFAGSGQADLPLLSRLLPSKLQVALAGDKLQKLGIRLQNAQTIDDFYLSLVSEWPDPQQLVIDGHEPATLLSRRGDWPRFSSVEERMMYLDSASYLPGDILTKVDRAGMGVSLESRVPFLDHRLVELSWQIPLNMKVRAGQGKWLLRQILDKYVPGELIERPKQGFAIPLGEWLRGPLRDWAEDLLDPRQMAVQGYLRSDLIQQKWQQHKAGQRNWEQSLWAVLMFQAWLQENC
jgi:asparagine synthase (glutamine-hydrolysing)